MNFFRSAGENIVEMHRVFAIQHRMVFTDLADKIADCFFVFIEDAGQFSALSVGKGGVEGKYFLRDGKIRIEDDLPGFFAFGAVPEKVGSAYIGFFIGYCL